MGNRIYVGNLSFSTTEGDVLDLFRLIGTVVSCRLMLDRETRQSRGYAFVEMSSAEESSLAIADFNGKELDGRRLNVNEARPRAVPPRREYAGMAEPAFGGDRRPRH